MDDVDWDAAGVAAAAGNWVTLRETLTGSRRSTPREAALLDEVGDLLDRALERAAEEGGVEAIFVELGHEGRAAAYLCHSYLPLDDWPADFTTSLEGPVVRDGRDRSDQLTTDRLHRAAGLLFPALGRALRRRRPDIPVGAGVHDGPVLYPWVPPGALRPDTVPRTRVPDLLEGWYALVPVRRDSLQMAGVETAHDWRWEGALRSWQTYRRGSFTNPTGVARARLVRGQLEDVLHVGTVGGPWLVSERLRDGLLRASGAGEGVDEIRFAVEDGSGRTHRYFLTRPTLALRPSEVAGHRVFDLDVPHFREWSAAIVSADALQSLVESACLVGVAAVRRFDLPGRAART